MLAHGARHVLPAGDAQAGKRARDRDGPPWYPDPDVRPFGAGVRDAGLHGVREEVRGGV